MHFFFAFIHVKFSYLRINFTRKKNHLHVHTYMYNTLYLYILYKSVMNSNGLVFSFFLLLFFTELNKLYFLSFPFTRYYNEYKT